MELHNEALIRDLLRALGEDPNREGLQETPARVMKAWREWTSGYDVNVQELLKTYAKATR